MKKKSESYQPEKSQKKKQNPWNDYDFDELPELSPAQLNTFKPVSKATFEKRLPTKIRRVGRPRKKPQERENQISIRFKPMVLKKIKAKARLKGYRSYQRYIKAVLEREIK